MPVVIGNQGVEVRALEIFAAAGRPWLQNARKDTDQESPGRRERSKKERGREGNSALANGALVRRKARGKAGKNKDSPICFGNDPR